MKNRDDTSSLGRTEVKEFSYSTALFNHENSFPGRTETRVWDIKWNEGSRNDPNVYFWNNNIWIYSIYQYILNDIDEVCGCYHLNFYKQTKTLDGVWTGYNRIRTLACNWTSVRGLDKTTHRNSSLELATVDSYLKTKIELSGLRRKCWPPPFHTFIWTFLD